MTRVSAEQSDPGYEAYCRNRRVVVLLDGDPQRLAVTADEEAGLLIRCKVDDRGRPLVANGALVKETLTGHVQIRPRR